MQYTLKTLAAAAALAVVGVANAAPVTVAGTSGTGTLSFSTALLESLDSAQVEITEVAPATAIIDRYYDEDLGGYIYNSASASAPITSVTADDVSNAVLSVATAGGATMVAPKAAGISSGGTLSVANLNVDLTTNRVYASITGNFSGAATFNDATGTLGKAGTAGAPITTLDNFYLWDFAAISGSTTISGPGTYNNAITGLTITEQGFAHFVSALRLGNTGINALKAVNNFGQIDSAITVAAVPEPSTYAMAIAGLALVGVAARRARKQA